MTRPEASPPKRWPTIADDGEDKYPERAPEGVVKDRWIDDFIERLHQTIEDIGRKC